MKDRRFWACWIFLGLLLPVLLAAQGQRPAPPPSAPPPPPAQGAGGRSGVTLEGKDVAVPVTISPSGPMFGLTPLVDLLGGQVTSDESGESITLRLADKDVVIGPGNAIVTVGDNIVSLSQPPSRGDWLAMALLAVPAVAAAFAGSRLAASFRSLADTPR